MLDTLARLHLAWGRIRRSDDIDTEAQRLLVGAFRRTSRDESTDDRVVLVLRHHDHLTDPEIADLMQTSVGAVRAGLRTGPDRDRSRARRGHRRR